MSKPGRVRRREILELLRECQHCTIAELGERFGISIPTVHRDINELVSANQVRKIHGGVEYALSSENDSSWNSGFEVRLNRYRQAKQEIARKAVHLLHEDDVIFLDSSTTALYLSRELVRADIGRLTVVTNSCCIASEFHCFPRHVTLISVGGVYNPQLNSFLGGIARDTVDSLRIGKVFLSAVGVSEHGIFTFHEDHAAFLRRLLEHCDTGILLADSSKFDREALFRICPLTSLTTVVGDRRIPDTARAWLAAAACKLI